MNNVIKTADKKNQYKDAIRKANILINAKTLDFKHYVTLPEEDRFSQIMLLYEKVQPHWVSEFNELEYKKPKKMRSHLDIKTTMKDLIDSAADDTLCQIAMSMYVANKLAHASENTRNVLLERYLEEKKKSSTESSIQLNKSITDKKDFKDLSGKIYNYFDPTNSYKKYFLSSLELDICRYGLDKTDLENLRKFGIDKLVAIQRSGFNIKDHEMMTLVHELQERDDISYGMVTSDLKDYFGNIIYSKDGTPKNEYLLVVDLPYYGQFSVHMKNSESISALSNTPYDVMKVYETESLILTPDISESAIKDFDMRHGVSMEKLKEIKETNPRYAHYLALKTGFTKQELDEMYDER